jgi:hypothetical protein
MDGRNAHRNARDLHDSGNSERRAAHTGSIAGRTQHKVVCAPGMSLLGSGDPCAAPAATPGVGCPKSGHAIVLSRCFRGIYLDLAKVARTQWSEACTAGPAGYRRPPRAARAYMYVHVRAYVEIA